jgi:hypothetical protein
MRKTWDRWGTGLHCGFGQPPPKNPVQMAYRRGHGVVARHSKDDPWQVVLHDTTRDGWLTGHRPEEYPEVDALTASRLEGLWGDRPPG